MIHHERQLQQRQALLDGVVGNIPRFGESLAGIRQSSSGLSGQLSADSAAASAVVTMARRLGLAVGAEGVETEAQRAFLVSIGCDLLQGFLFARPLSRPKFENWLRQRTNQPQRRRGD